MTTIKSNDNRKLTNKAKAASVPEVDLLQGEEPAPSEHEDSIVSQQVVLCLDDEVQLVQVHTSAWYVSLSSSCLVLGLNARGQLQRIQRTPQLSVGLRQFSLQTRGGSQRINCLRLDLVPEWLTSMHSRLLTAELRAKIDTFVLTITEAVTTRYPDTQQSNTRPTEDLVQQMLPSLEEVTSEDLHEQRALLATLPGISSASVLITTSFQEDRAIREASLAHNADWQEEPMSQRMRYTASNKLQVYLGDPEYPLHLTETLEAIRELGEGTVLTARIILGLWNIRRVDQQLAKDGSAAIRIDDILEWRGVQKHSRAVYPGAQKRATDGYQWKHKQQAHRDIKLLELCHLRGHHTINFRGKTRQFLIDGPYIRVTSLKETTGGQEEEIIGYFIAPGAWINTYEEHGNLFLAEIDRRIFQLHPQNDQIALRIALYLTEHWRQHMRTGRYRDPIAMENLLGASMVPIDRNNLTSRFAPRVEAALSRLCERGIVKEARLLTPIDTTQARWGKEWLKSLWSILPPDNLLHRVLPGRNDRDMLTEAQQRMGDKHREK